MTANNTKTSTQEFGVPKELSDKLNAETKALLKFSSDIKWKQEFAIRYFGFESLEDLEAKGYKLDIKIDIEGYKVLNCKLYKKINEIDLDQLWKSK